MRACRAVGVLLLVLAACAPTAPERAPDVLLVILDAAGAEHLGLYGGRPGVTPHIDALAEESVVWERAYAQAPQTTASMGSLLTGRYPAEVWTEHRLRGRLLPEQLGDAGYHTVGISENPWVTPGRGFGRGLDSFDFRLPTRPSTPGERSSVERALDALGASEGPPVFVYLHLLPPHSPYDAPPPLRGRYADAQDPGHPMRGFMALMLGAEHAQGAASDLQAVMAGESPLSARDAQLLHARYDENLAWADARVGELLAGLRAAGQLDRTLLIVTADHGEAFGEHGHYGHATSLYDEQIRVPLLVRLPRSIRVDGAVPGQRRAAPVELADLPATLAELLELPPTAGELPGRSLFDPERSGEEPVRSFLDDRRQAIVLGRHKLLLSGDEDPQLFDLQTDPDETRDLAKERPEIVKRLRESAWSAPSSLEIPRVHDLAPEKRERLEELGYFD